MTEIRLQGIYTHKHIKQLLKEAGWIIQNLARATTFDEINKWKEKWLNWSKAHPNEATQINKQMGEW